MVRFETKFGHRSDYSSSGVGSTIIAMEERLGIRGTGKAIIAVLSCAVLLWGCIWKMEWRDTTGQNRGEPVSKADYDACYRSAAFPEKDAVNTAKVVFDAAVIRLNECMASKGWELVRAYKD